MSHLYGVHITYFDAAIEYKQRKRMCGNFDVLFGGLTLDRCFFPSLCCFARLRGGLLHRLTPRPPPLHSIIISRSVVLHIGVNAVMERLNDVKLAGVAFCGPYG